MKQSRGFTLIELMIAVAVIAFLAAIALPSYQGQLRKSRRASAQAFMMEISQRQQARFLDTRNFATINNNGEVLTQLGLPVPADVSPYFDLDVDVTGPPPGFTVFAVAKSSQDFKNQEDLQLRSSGFKARGDKAGASWDESKW